MRRWRVGTVSMGLMLVATGVLLLFGELQGINGARLILRWWPAILVILGLEILAYVLFSKEEQTKIKFDGFSIILTIFIILTSSGIYAANSFFNSDLSRHFLGDIGYYKYETMENKSYEIDPAKVTKLQVSNINGKVNINKYDGSKIVIDTSIIVRNNNEEEAKRHIGNLVEIVEGETLAVNTRNSSLFENNRNYQTHINYTIRVPKELNYEISSSGEIELDNLTGNIKVTGKNGQITAKDIRGNLQAENAFGQINVKNVTGKVHVENEHGAVVYANNSPCQDLTLKSRMGRISVELPQNQQGTFKLSTRFGQLAIDGFGTDSEIKKGDNKQTFEKIIGDASPVISIEAEHGEIDIRAR